MERSVGKFAELVSAAARNALEVARFGGLDTGEEPSPYDVVHERPIYRLRHYYPDTSSPAKRPVILLVPPMMLAADVFDVSPSSSAAAVLHEHGIDPWVIDFGAPEREEGGLERTLTDHILALSEAIDEVRARVGGADVHIGGYSQGGMFCYQTAAYRRAEGIASVVTFGSPVDTKGMLPFGIPDETLMRVVGFAADRVLARTNLPAWASRTGFRLLDPVKSVRQRIDFLLQLHDRDALLPRERQRRFLQQDGWVAWPGPALAELASQIIAGNRMLSGGMVIEGRTVTLADISCPVLCFVGDVDEIAAPAVVRAVRRAAPLAEIYEVGLHAGHFGLVVGSTANESSWPITAAWLRWQEGQGPEPAAIQPLPEDAGDEAETDPSFVEGVLEGVTVAATLGVETTRLLARSAGRGAGGLRDLAAEAAQQLPRLARLEGVRPTSRVSLGRLLDEQAEGSPDDTVFLFEGRGVTYADANRRIDNVVRGLISVGVRQGEHVGVLMATRPSAITVVAALNRIGAVAVLLRPGGEVAREVGLGSVNRIVTDPEHAPLLRLGDADVQLFVLGGGGAPRDLAADLRIPAGTVVDMERIDPAQVALPSWYRANPGRARDLAFVVFTGAGERTQVKRITNGRWALSAFGTATAASLSPADTVYGLTPVHHPAGLLTALGGSVAGGARLAMATHFDPATFWDEVRRYGVTVVSYTWSQVHDLVAAPTHPLERGHAVRLFLGSGMPVGLWRRVLDRFAPAGVLEFYGSTEGEAVLVNLRGTKVGCKGRPLPGSNEVRIAAYDTASGRIVVGPDGFARKCGRGEVGMLLVTAERDTVGTATPLRSVFARDDSWLETGDLFRRDGEGDYWFVGDGTTPIEDEVYGIAAVDLCVAYRVGDRLVAAVTLRPGTSIDEAALAGQHADVVRVVDEIPKTAWFRLQSAHLRAEGIPASSAEHPAFVLTDDGSYKKLTPARRKALLGP